MGRQAAWQREEDAWTLTTSTSSDRAAFLHNASRPFEMGRVNGTDTYYLVLFGHMDGIHFEVNTAYVLLKSKILAASIAAWYEASHLVAETSIKIDAGIQGRLEGMLWGVKCKADVNVVKADLLEVKADFTKADKFSYDYAGRHGTTKLTNSLTVAADIPWLPETPWGRLGLGGTIEQSQLINKDFISSDYKQDWGLYTIVPLFKSKGLKSFSEKLKANPATSMAKAPSVNAKVGRPKGFVGVEAAAGAALLVGIEVKGKFGLAQ